MYHENFNHIKKLRLNQIIYTSFKKFKTFPYPYKTHPNSIFSKTKNSFSNIKK